jgi:hypothetical protein
MSHKVLSVAATVAAALTMFSPVASATTFLCKCATAFAPTVASGALNLDNNNFTCDQTWTNNSTGHDTGGYNSYVKFSFPDAAVTGSSTNVKFAPRTAGECLARATDAVNTKQEWSGLWCDTGNLNVNGFNFSANIKDGQPTGTSKISGRMDTTTKANKFAAFYTDSGDRHTLVAVCAEKK